MQLQQSEVDAKELQDIETITSVLTQLSADDARKLLRQYNGNLERAITAALDPEPAPIIRVEDTDNRTSEDWPEIRKQHNNSPNKSQPPVIDLTGDDDEKMGRALKASLEKDPVFGPPNRPGAENWSVVPTSNLASAEDQSLSQAIEASLSTYSIAEDDKDGGYVTKRREKPKPVALRPASVNDVHIALLLQCLFSLNSIRHAVALLDSSFSLDEDEGNDFDETLVQALIQTFIRLDIGELGSIDPDEFIRQVHLRRDALTWSMRDTPGYRTTDVLKILIRIFETVYKNRLESLEPSRLFQFTISQVGPESFIKDPEEIDVVDVTAGTYSTSPNELFALLKSEMRNGTYIRDLSEVLVFHIIPDSTFKHSGGSSNKDPKPFKYPTYLYLDQFYHQNRDINEEIRHKQANIEEEIKRLTQRRDNLTLLQGKEALTELRTTIHYYESVAQSNGNPARQKTIEETTAKLKFALGHIEGEVKLLDEQLKVFKEQHASAYDVPELQNLRYDLKAVLVHNGLYGRKNIYSYVKSGGSWWQTIDYEVTKVSEDEVLGDTSGLHFGAGPFMLFYARVHSESSDFDSPLPWSVSSKSKIELENVAYLDQLDQPGTPGPECSPSSEMREISMTDLTNA